ncbi:MAG: hypothetical protein WAT12_15380 [Candidatus Nitrotoga sp.]
MKSIPHLQVSRHWPACTTSLLPPRASGKGHENFKDRSHRPHTLNTTLTPDQELLVVELRRMLLLPMDELLAINNP